jgi:hypothetical protein
MSLSAAETLTLALASILVVLLGLMGYRAWQSSRVSPEERERRRRSLLVARGKMGDAQVLDIRDEVLVYSYGVRGVEYTASQDISHLRDYLPPDYHTSIGPVVVRYDPRNPANSIVLAEDWSGLRINRRSA